MAAPQMTRLKRLRAKLADRKERRDRNRAKYQRTGKGGREIRKHIPAIRKLRKLIREILSRPLRTSRRGVDFIKSFEGFSPRPVNIGDGVLTWGYGHTAPLGSKVPNSINEPAATRLLAKDLAKTYEPAVRKLFKKDGPLHHHRGNQHLIDALVSVAYNLGTGAVQSGPHPGFETLGRAIAAGSPRQIAAALPLYSNPGSQFHEGLLRRRRCEAQLILTGNYSTTA
jgi:lysozyme